MHKGEKMSDVTPSKDIRSAIKFCVSANYDAGGHILVRIKSNNMCTAQLSIQMTQQIRGRRNWSGR